MPTLRRPRYLAAVTAAVTAALALAPTTAPAFAGGSSPALHAAAVGAVLPSADATTPGVDDFEAPLATGADGSVPVGWFAAQDPSSTAGFARTDTPPAPVPGAATPNTVLRTDVTVTSWAVVVHAFEDASASHWVTQDWSTYAGLQFWMYGTGAGTGLFVDVIDNRNPGSTKDDAERWTASFVDDTAGWRLVQLPFDAMTRKEVGNGAPNDGFGLTEVHGWAFGSLTTDGAASFYLDDVALYGVATPKPLTVGFATADTHVVEGATASVGLALSKPSADPVTVTVSTSVVRTATPKVDYAPVSTTVTFPPNQTRASVAVPTYGDAKHQGDRAVVLELSSPTGAALGRPPVTRLLITDDDALDPTLVEDFESHPYLWSANRGTSLLSRQVNVGSPFALPGQSAPERVLSADPVGTWVSTDRAFAQPQDWSSHAALSFMYYGRGTGQPVRVGLQNTAAPAAGAPSTVAWADEFSTAAGTRPNPSIWTTELGDGTIIGAPGWGNDELEYYTSSPLNASTDGAGHLVLTTRKTDPGTTLTCYYGPCAYTSARLATAKKAEFAYGRIESRILVPRGAGLWPAFWSLGTDIGENPWPRSGEIDIMEHVGRMPQRVFGTIHGPGYSGGTSFGGTYDFPVNVADSYHVYSVDWSPDLIVWKVDGIEYHRATPANVAPNDWVFNHPFSLLLNVAVGGNFGGTVGADTTFPQKMKVDYVRVYRPKTTTASYTTSFKDSSRGWRLVTLPLAQFLDPTGRAVDASRISGMSFATVEPASLPMLLDQIRLACSPSITVSSAADSGAGSLREALGAVCSGGTVSLAPSLAGTTLELATPLSVGGTVTLDGSAAPGAALSGRGAVRVLEVAASGRLTVKGLVLTKGYGYELGGAVLNNGQLTLDHVTVSDSRVSTSGNDWWKGGAGIYSGEGATLTLRDSTVRGNAVDGGPGGGLYSRVGTTTTIERSTISGNSATDVGGGMRSLGTTALINSTVSGNSATGWHGGGLFQTDGVMTVTASTVTLNSSPGGTSGGLFVGTFGDSAASLVVTSSIVAGNTGEQCFLAAYGAGPVSLTSGGHNVVGDGTCGAPATGDRTAADPMLGPLADNGGPTWTHLPAVGSPAVDGGDPAVAGAMDQRGVTRPQGAGPDSGSVELAP